MNLHDNIDEGRNDQEAASMLQILLLTREEKRGKLITNRIERIFTQKSLFPLLQQRLAYRKKEAFRSMTALINVNDFTKTPSPNIINLQI